MKSLPTPRKLAAVVLAAALGDIPLLTACTSTSTSQGQAEAGADAGPLEVWSRGADPGVATTYEKVFAAFTKKTGIKIDYKPVIDFDQQLQAAPPSKDLPDVMINDTGRSGATEQGLLRPIDTDAIAGDDQITATWSRPWPGRQALRHPVLPSGQRPSSARTGGRSSACRCPPPADELGVPRQGLRHPRPGRRRRGRHLRHGRPRQRPERLRRLVGRPAISGRAAARSSRTRARQLPRPRIDAAAVAEAVTWMKRPLLTATTSSPGALTFVTSRHADFQDGNAGMYLTGPYNIDVFDKALGKDKYEVIPMPAGPAGTTTSPRARTSTSAPGPQNEARSARRVPDLARGPGDRHGRGRRGRHLRRAPARQLHGRRGAVYDDPRWGVVPKAYARTGGVPERPTSPRSSRTPPTASTPSSRTAAATSPRSSSRSTRASTPRSRTRGC